jgi:hypothetical protein
MKVLHLPADIGGHAWSLAQAERARGLDSQVLVRSAGWGSTPADIRLDAGTPSLRSAAVLAGTFLKIRSRYDVFHFNFGSSLMHSQTLPVAQPELGLYPRKARVFASYNGCDARQKFPTMARGGLSACLEEDCYGGMCNSGVRDERRRAGIDRMAERAEHLWALNPDLLRFLPAEKSSFLPYSIAPPGLAVQWPRAHGPVRVAHAPTDRGAKGTKYVLGVFDDLARAWPGRFEFDLVEGVTREEALRRYHAADVVVDQLLIGWYGAVGVEAMLLGKTVCVFVKNDDLGPVPVPMRNDLEHAVVNITPATLHDQLLRLEADRTLLLRTAQAGHAYAGRWHDPAYVAGLTAARYAA